MNTPTGERAVLTSFAPAVHPGELPALHEFKPRVFEQLCRDLLREEEGISGSTLWGKEGQGQQGIDILADASDGVHHEAGQCKCYREFTPAAIRKACSDFRKHCEHWKEYHIRRFVLFVACDVETVQCRKAILEQKRLFGAQGISFEVWDRSHIVAKLNPHPGVVRRFFANPEHWVSVICGEARPVSMGMAPAPQHDYTSRLVSEQLNTLADALSTSVSRAAERGRNALREGRHREALELVREIRSDETSWRAATPAVQATVLRLEAHILLATTGDPAEPTRLADAADAIDPAEGSRLRVLLAHATGGAESGLRTALTHDLKDPELRAALLLDAGRVGECLEVLDAAADGGSSTAGLQRVRVLALLSKSDPVQARAVAAQALEEQPRWESLQIAAAMADWMSVLSPAALPGYLPAWPAPVTWTLLRRDDESVERLRKAEAVFRDVATRPEHLPESTRQMEGWRLACLACDPERQAEAEALCRSLLEEFAEHPAALAWSTARRFPIPFDASVRSMQTRVRQDPADVSVIVSLANLYLDTGRAGEAGDLLDQSEEHFGENRVVWHAWRARAADEASDEPRLQVILQGIADDDRLAELEPMRRRLLAERSRDWSSLTVHLAKEYQTTGDARSLLDSCIAAARGGLWSHIRAVTDDLLELVQTAEAVRMAAYAHSNLGEHRQALDLLDEHLNFFRQRRLPPDLRRLRVSAQEALGVLPSAVLEAEELVRDDPATENLLALARVYASKADLRGAASTVRRLVSRPDLSPADALSLASMIWIDDPEPARDLWRRVAGGRLDLESLENSVCLGYKLGMDAEMGPLVRRFARLGGQTGRLRILSSVEEALPLLSEAREQASRAWLHYQRGDGPVHALARAGGLSLVDLYHSGLVRAERATSPALQSPLWIRHGGRPLPPLVGEATRRRLLADTTALLLAHHLDLLDVIERFFGTIEIPPEVIPALRELRSSLAHHQASEVEAARIVVRAGSLGLFASGQGAPSEFSVEVESWHSGVDPEWADLWRSAVARDAFVGDDLPLYLNGDLNLPVELPHAVRARVVDGRGVTEALLDAGMITRSAHDVALAALPTGRVGAAEGAPSLGAVILAAPGFATELARLGVLAPACDAFSLVLDPDELDEATSLLEAVEGREMEMSWLVSLIERVRAGIDQGSYHVMESKPDEAEPDELFELNRRPPWLAALRTLLRATPGPHDAIWIDDRWVTGFQALGSAPVIDTVEVLATLVRGGAISRPAYFRCLHRLRASNARLIVPTADELVYHLARANLTDGHVVESRELANLRRYVAATLLSAAHLQRGFAPDGTLTGRHELPYVAWLQNAVDDAIGQVWEQAAEGVATRRARAQWLVDNMYLDLASARSLSGLHAPDDDDRYLMAVSLVGLVARGIVMPGSFIPDREHDAAEYQAWVASYVLAPRFEADPLLPATLAHILRQHLLEVGRDLPEELRVLRSIALQKSFDRLPEALRHELAKDDEFMSEAHLKTNATITVAGFVLPHAAFVRAAARAVNGSTARVPLADGQGHVRLLPVRDIAERPAIIVARGRSRRYVDGSNPVLGAMMDSPVQREKALLRARDYYSGPPSRFTTEVARIASMSSVKSRVAAVEAMQEVSPSVHYASISIRIANHQRIAVEDMMPPDLGAFVQDHGIGLDVASADALRAALDKATRERIQFDGILSAFHRACGMPVSLPESLRVAFAAEDPERRRTLVRALLGTARSPIARVHLIRLLSVVPDQFGRLARRLSRRMISVEAGVRFAAFAAMLDHAEAEFVTPATGGWSVTLRVAMLWSHTHRLFEALSDAKAKLEAAPALFKHYRRRELLRLFARDRALESDIAHPKVLRRPSFLLAALAYATEGLSWGEPVLAETAVNNLIQVDQETNGGVDLNLIHDPTLCGNTLGSFLAIGRGEAFRNLTGSEASHEFDPESRRAYAEDRLARLEHGGGLEDWLHLSSVIGENPIYTEMRERFGRLVLQADVSSFYDPATQEGILPLRTLATQAASWGSSELIHSVEEKLESLARGLSPDAGPAVLESAADALLDLVYRLVQRRGDTGGAAEEFARIAQRVVDACPQIAPYWRFAAQRLWTELPASCVRSLAPLVVRTRAA